MSMYIVKYRTISGNRKNRDVIKTVAVEADDKQDAIRLVLCSDNDYGETVTADASPHGEVWFIRSMVSKP